MNFLKLLLLQKNRVDLYSFFVLFILFLPYLATNSYRFTKIYEVICNSANKKTNKKPKKQVLINLYIHDIFIF